MSSQTMCRDVQDGVEGLTVQAVLWRQPRTVTSGGGRGGLLLVGEMVEPETIHTSFSFLYLLHDFYLILYLLC